MPSVHKKTLLTHAGERKLAIIIATVATFAVLTTVIWNTFFSQPIITASAPVVNHSVSITEKPPSLQQAITPPSHTTHKQAIHKQSLPPTSAKKSNTVTVGKGKLYVQVGAFKEVKGARTIYEKMRKTYKRAQIMPKSGY
ncbi:MAG: hypothetical protein Q9M75_07675, partial [Ghiorsea sp.]|nr:hypothetical protein [Ghiorsea sp.]